MKKITLKNSYHNTECIVLADTDDASEYWENLNIAAMSGDTRAINQKRRIHAKLCGSSDCKCGTVR